jgi:uncharacterized membrane protein YciS (DUF1049 family)
LCSSVIAPGISFMNAEFHNTSSILSTLTVSIFILGFAVRHIIPGIYYPINTGRSDHLSFRL